MRGAVPSLNLPVKSVAASTSTTRRELVRQELGKPVVYHNFASFKKRILDLKMKGWLKRENEDTVIFEFWNATFSLPKLTCSVTSGLNFSVAVYNWLLSDDHTMYSELKRSLKHTSISNIMAQLEGYDICEGLDKNELTYSKCEDPSPTHSSSSVIRHTVPINPEHYDEDGPPFQAHIFLRSPDCELLCRDSPCPKCSMHEKSIHKPKEKSHVQPPQPVKDKAPLSRSSKERLVATVQRQRIVCKELEGRLTQLEKEISENSISVDEALEKDILTILADSGNEVTPHMRVFWEQQQKMLASSKFGRRYHPHIIRFCLSIHAKSPAAYRELRDSGVLVLPSEKTLRDYRNFFTPRAGFHPENVQRLVDQTSQYFDIQRYVVIAFDEMKIQSKLVFDKHSNELIGFVDLGEEELNVSSLGSTDLATHALVFFVRGAATKLKYALAYFLTKDITSYQIMPLFWKAVSVLELVCNLWVCAAVSDGASPNRLFFQLHADLVDADAGDLVHYTTNLFAPSRKIYFFSDAPHLLKTARNCLFNSGSGKRTRYLWNNDKYMLWEHIAKLYYSDLDLGLHQLPKLTVEHIQLKSFAKMKVSFAVQVLSNTVAQALQRHYSSGEASETAKFCKMMNNFFDCMNVRSTSEHERKRNPMLAPYQHTDDSRFDWLKNEFLPYLASWKASVDVREGPFSGDDRGRMFLSVQTFTGLKITVNSVIALTRFLLSEGFEFVLTERFCQDDVEEYFGYQRTQGRRNDNPTAAEFGYNDLRIATLRDVAPQSIQGNVSGRHSGKRSKWCDVSEEPLPKKKTKKLIKK